MADLSLVDTDELAAELLRRCDTGVVCYSRAKVPQGGRTLVCWQSEGDARTCLGLMQEVGHHILLDISDGEEAIGGEPDDDD